MKIRLVEAELFHVDGETDGRTDRHDEANSYLRNLIPVVRVEIIYVEGSQ